MLRQYVFAARNRKSRKSVVQFEKKAAEKQNLIYSLDHTGAPRWISVQRFGQGRPALAVREAGSAPEEHVRFPPLPPPASPALCYGLLEGGARSLTRAHIHIKVLFIPIKPTSTAEFWACIGVQSKRYPPPHARCAVPAELYRLAEGHTGGGNMAISAGTSWCLFFWGIATWGSNLQFSVSIRFLWDCVPCKDFILVAP